MWMVIKNCFNIIIVKVFFHLINCVQFNIQLCFKNNFFKLLNTINESFYLIIYFLNKQLYSVVKPKKLKLKNCTPKKTKNKCGL